MGGKVKKSMIMAAVLVGSMSVQAYDSLGILITEILRERVPASQQKEDAESVTVLEEFVRMVGHAVQRSVAVAVAVHKAEERRVQEDPNFVAWS